MPNRETLELVCPRAVLLERDVIIPQGGQDSEQNIRATVIKTGSCSRTAAETGKFVPTSVQRKKPPAMFRQGGWPQEDSDAYGGHYLIAGSNQPDANALS